MGLFSSDKGPTAGEMASAQQKSTLESKLRYVEAKKEDASDIFAAQQKAIMELTETVKDRPPAIYVNPPAGPVTTKNNILILILIGGFLCLLGREIYL